MARFKEDTVFKLGEFFCGPGGMALGAKNAGITDGDVTFKFQHQWATDYDKDSCDTYRRNICGAEGRVICRDVRRLDFTQFPPIDVFAFGFPCNDFSLVGEKKGVDGAYGPLYAFGVEALKYFQPKFFIAENVGGLRSSNDGHTFKVILSELCAAGYEVTPHLYKFEQYGVPQSRHRIIIVGIRSDLNLTFKVPYQPVQIQTAQEALEIPPIPEGSANHEKARMSALVVERLQYIKPGQNAWNAELPNHLRLNVKGATMSQIYRRLDPAKPAYTITGSGGGGTHVYHWCEDRALTNRERARLQTFPDSFVFEGSKESVRKQIGMAVPPQGAKVVFEAILKTFAGIPYPTVEPNITFKSEALFK